MKKGHRTLALCLAATLSGCGHGPDDRRGELETGTKPSGQTYAVLFQRVGLKDDRRLTRPAFDTVLHADFASFDANHDQKLDRTEVRRTNAQQLTDHAMSPTIDWNDDGFVSFEEFAAQWRTAFDAADTNRDDVLDASELAAPIDRPVRQHDWRSKDGGKQGGDRPDELETFHARGGS